MKFVKTPVKGMNDMLPADMRMREHVLDMIKRSYALYGFMQIETPCMEHIENLTSKQGGDNEKLIFKVMKRGAELSRALEKGGELADNGLRYDLTVPLARYYANNREKLPAPFKALQIGSVWRADNPQKGRFRQFTQCDIDILGDDSSLAEIELIAATSETLSRIFAEVGLTRFTVHVNDRRILRAAAMAAGFSEEEVPAALISLDKFDKLGLEGVREDLIQSGFDAGKADRYLAGYGAASADGGCAGFCRKIPPEYLDGAVAAGMEEIISGARSMVGEGVEIRFDPTLVRGMGYYTGPIFEVSIDGYGFSIAGGGRYDRMIGRFCGQEVSASGFSIGFERIITILKDRMEKGTAISGKNRAILIDKKVPLDKKLEIFSEARRLRGQGVTVTIQPMRKNVGQQIERLEAEGYTDFQKVYND